MKKVYWILIAIAIALALAEGYALYKIPKSETIKGVLNYESPAEILPSTIFKLSLESQAQGESEFAILASSESNIFKQFPQSFSLPVLSQSLSKVGIYQLRVQVINNHKILYVNKGLIQLTRSDLSKVVNIEMQIPPKVRTKIVITPTIKPTEVVRPTAVIEEVILVTPEPVKLDVKNLLGNKLWILQTKQGSKAHLNFDMERGYAFGSGGCNKFQGGYQVEQSQIKFNQFIASSKYCDGLMDVESYFLESLPKVTNWLVKEEAKTLYLYDNNKQLLLQFHGQ